MIRKIILFTVLSILCLCAVGCESIDYGYPYIKIYRSPMESRTTEIGIGNGYKMNNYEKHNNNDGSCSVIINFIKE